MYDPYIKKDKAKAGRKGQGAHHRRRAFVGDARRKDKAKAKAYTRSFVG